MLVPRQDTSVATLRSAGNVTGGQISGNTTIDESNKDGNGDIGAKVKRASAYETRFEAIDTALQSLDSLNEQILQFIFSSSLNNAGTGSVSGLISSFDSDALLPKQRDALTASLTLMRRLLMDAQTKFKKMVDDNRRLASHIDGTIQSANQEVNTLRIELDMTNKKLRELSMRDSCQHCQGRRSEVRELKKLVEENKRLSSENRQLQKETENLRQQASCVSELAKTKLALHEMMTDMRLIQDEKRDVFIQLEELHTLLDEKEEQLRSFIRQYENQMQEQEAKMASLEEDKSRLIHEKDDLTHKNNEVGEIISSLRHECVSKDKRIRDLETELSQTIEFLSPSQIQAKNRRSCNSDEYANHKVTNLSVDNNLTIDSADLIASPASPRTFLSNVPYSSSSNEEVCGVGNGQASIERASLEKPNRKRTKLVTQLSGSLSRAWGRARNRKSLDISNTDVFLSGSRMSLYDRTDDEKKEIMDESKILPMHKWRADTVQVWLELVMHMSQYTKECVENVKSGKVLLGMTEDELETCLYITNPLHKRKLKYAIDEFQNPAVTISTMSAAGQLDHWWVSEHWMRDVGLSQYASKFRENLVDGRVLNSLTRKDLERHLGIDSKRHQDSIIKGIELLSMLGFDKQRLEERRQMCHSCDADLVVWSNNRLIQWAKSVDLKEYAFNLRESGVHGALLVLDTSFNSDDLATALGIPSSKTILRRHLATEFDALVRPARETFKEENGLSNNTTSSSSLKKRGGSLSYSFIRSTDQTRRSRRSLRSISRSFGRHLGRDYHMVNGTDRETK
ncbi:kazrin-like isoform X3 [Styela clava]